MRRWIMPVVWLLSRSAWAGEQARWPDLSSPPAPTGAKPGANDAAVLIGIENYDKVSPIRGARQNVLDWQAWLLRTRGVPAASIIRRTDGDAVKEEIEAALQEGAERVKPGGTLWVVYIGHGAPTEDGDDGLLVGADTRDTPTSIYSRGLPRGRMMELLAGGKQASTVVLLDSCFSGKGVDGRDLVSEPLAPLRGVKTGVQPASLTVLTATRDNQFAGLLPGVERPAFSYLVLGALRGWGDADGDGIVRASEAADYARGALNLMVTGRRQEPEVAGPDVSLGKGKETGPDLAEMSMPVKAARPTGAAASPTTSGGFGDLSIDVDVDRMLEEQACEDEARREGANARTKRLDAAAKQAQAEAKAAWAKLGPQAEACVKVTESAARKECAATVDAFVARAEALQVSVEAGMEAVDTACGPRSAAFPAEIRKVSVGEVAAAKSIVAELRRAPAAMKSAGGEKAAAAKKPEADAETAHKRRLESIERLKELLSTNTAPGDTTAEMILRLANLYFEEARFQHQVEEQAGQAHAGSASWYDKSIKLYRQILQNYPQFSRADEATLYLAMALEDTNQADAANSEFTRLVKTYPESRWIPDAYLHIGEHWFEKNEAYKSLVAYQRAAAFKDFDKRGFALYKLAWCYYNIGEYGKAEETMETVLRLEGQPSQLSEEAQKDLARFRKDMGK